MQTNGFGQQPFKAIPKTQRVENGIQHVRDGAIVAVLRVGVVERVMFGRLQDFNVL